MSRRPDRKAAPPLLSVSYDPAEDCDEDLAELASSCVQAWARAGRLPITIKTVAGELEQPGAADFEALTLAMLAIAACRKQMRKTKGGWPLREGATEEVSVTPANLEPRSIHVRGNRLI